MRISKTQCLNCKMKEYCNIIHWAGSKEFLTVYNYVNKYKIKNCHHFAPKLLIRIKQYFRKAFNDYLSRHESAH